MTLAELLASLAALQGCGDTVAAVSACSPDDVSLKVGQPSLDGSQFRTELVIANGSNEPCSIFKRPIVQLLSDTTKQSRASIGVLYEGVDENTSDAVLEELFVVPSRGRVAAPLTYLPGPDECDNNEPWVPNRVVVTANASVEVVSAWSGGSVDDCQQGATHPGTFVGPFGVTN